MDLEKLSARLRPRKTNETMDLGVCMVRHYFVPVFLPYVMIAAPIAAALLWLVPGFWGVALVWWLVPIFGRVPLFVLSRAIFGDLPRLPRVLREAPRMLTRSLFLPLTFGRFSPFRTFQLPVAELEQQRGRKYSQRCRVLRIDQDRGAWGLLTMSGVVVLCVWAGLTLAGGSLHEVFLGSIEEELGIDEGFVLPQWSFVLLAVSILLIEPFHVAGGFSLYLNRRQVLEGWDIELTFRRLANRIAASRSSVIRSAGLLLMLALSGAALPAQAEQENPPQTSTQQGDEDPQAKIRVVLEDKAFGSERMVKRWEYVGTAPTFSGPNLGFAGQALWVLAWILGIGAIAWILYKIIQSFGRGREARLGGERGPPPAEVMGLDVRPESLPDDPAEEAWRLWESGDAAGCLGLLYRAALIFLIHERALEIRRSFTEADCLQLVQEQQPAELFAYFRALTGAWQSCAYAHRIPAETQARALCDRWPEHFGMAGVGA